MSELSVSGSDTRAHLSPPLPFCAASQTLITSDTTETLAAVSMHHNASVSPPQSCSCSSLLQCCHSSSRSMGDQWEAIFETSWLTIMVSMVQLPIRSRYVFDTGWIEQGLRGEIFFFVYFRKQFTVIFNMLRVNCPWSLVCWCLVQTMDFSVELKWRSKVSKCCHNL